MQFSDQFFRALGVRVEDKKSLTDLSRKVNIPLSRLNYYNDKNIVPSGTDLESLILHTDISETELMLKMGILDKKLIDKIQNNAEIISKLLNEKIIDCNQQISNNLVYETQLGKLFQGDCLSLMKTMDSNSIDLIFADPPFNLNKLYPSNIDDAIKSEKYIQWSQEWLIECVRLLKNGGSFFLWNLPKWNIILADYLNNRLNFKHWISVDIKYSLPIQGRLYPSHYSLLYYTKGETPNTFHPDRLAMSICPHCYGDLKDYGGYKDKMNPKGISLTDVWLDIPPVRHAKYKRRIGANELSLKLLDRIIEMASDEKDVIFDPFGGSGTTYMAAELKGRKWIGVEIGPPDDIVDRFSKIDEERKILCKYRSEINTLFTNKVLKNRLDLGWWTSDTVKKTVEQKQLSLGLELHGLAMPLNREAANV